MVVSMRRRSVKHSIKEGDKFGRLTIISYTDRQGKKGEYKCLCECGSITYSRTWSLKSGKSESCGCLMKEKASIRFKLPNNQGIINDLYRNYKKASERRKYDFNLTIEQFTLLIENKCFYCGIVNSMTPYGNNKLKKNYKYNGIDRIDNDKGYVIDNVVTCCKICNNSKSTLSIQEFKEWIIRISNNINNF